MTATYYAKIATSLTLTRAIISQEGLDIRLHQLKKQFPGVDFADFIIHTNEKRRHFTSNWDDTRFGYQNWLDSNENKTDQKKINVFSHNYGLQNNTLLMTLGDYLMMHNFASQDATIVPSHFEINDAGINLIFRVDLTEAPENPTDITKYVDEIENRLIDDTAITGILASKTIRVVNDLNPETPELRTLLDENLVIKNDFRPTQDDIIIQDNKFRLTPNADILFLTDPNKVTLQVGLKEPIID